jgi:PKD repeat protein
MWSETPGVVWILFPFNPSNTMSFFWDFGDGNTSTEPFPTNIYDLAGTYTVCLTVMDANGCTGITCLTFTVTPEGDFLPGGMPMTGFTLNVVNAIPNSVQEVSSNIAMEAYPCPFNEQLNLTIQSALPGTALVSCYDMTGALMLQEQLVVSNQATKSVIETASWSRGAYTVVVNTPNGTIRRVVMK